MRQPLTGTERIYADILLDRLKVLGYKFERRRVLPKLYGYRAALEELSGATDFFVDRLAGELGLKQ
jgi:hypothetical protein